MKSGEKGKAFQAGGWGGGGSHERCGGRKEHGTTETPPPTQGRRHRAQRERGTRFAERLPRAGGEVGTEGL